MKSTFNKIFVASATIITLGMAGCDKIKDFEDTNTNPNGTPIPVTAALFTRAVAELGGREGGLAISAYTRPGYYAQYFSETQYPEASLYGVPQLEFTGNYSGFLNDLQNIIKQNTDEATKDVVTVSGSNANQIATARILKAYAFWTITDRWGDVPYSEALQGNPLPKYDTQESIYADLLKEFGEAVDQFDNGLGMKGDIIFNGNNTRWQRFANSLRMQIALRMSKVYPNAGGLAATEFNAALNHSAGSIETNSDNAKIDFPGGAYQNPWYVSYVVSSRIDDAISSTMTSTLDGYDDPRINDFGTSTTGFPYGLDRPNAVAVAPGWGLVLDGLSMSDAEDVIIMNAATVLFARAEAAERGWTSESASELYDEAITASMAQWGYTGAAVTNYLSQTGVAFGDDDHLRKIGTQKWIAMYPDGMQAWAEWRRTGFPVLTPAEYATNTTKEIPRRFVYGTGEYGTNNAAVKEAVGRLDGGDTQDARMWWDK
ncbi:SusD/RagB family nutrient-binding outer membrane lipoprotein [Flavihumibacter sp. UBA7668]|uniref:SusD/RagB family nutrient-binding outer membrane lipoprotein n=1 Tax=Flavihumibacter sp. UBA7668 TaxID=1946542 RepID=UPI0025BC839B|nr:SusD/RagB family nutrient-binding outer membrane lipoprotein [Flavihumibacter sp. UBA7668]